MKFSNPFRPTRFEHHEHPLIWISPNVKLLERLKSFYVAGTRGSGKTSLLKALNWRERLHNRTVADQLGDDALDYVAVYFRLPDYLTSSLGLIDWHKAFPDSQTPEIVGYGVFAQLIELVAAQLLCEAISSLRSVRRFTFSADDEARTVKKILQAYPQLEASTPSEIESLEDLSFLFRQLHQRMNLSITRGLTKALHNLPIEALPGVFINELAAQLRELACSDEGDCSATFHLKICIDDCETLQSAQQRYLNSLVRSAKQPLFWVISYVSVDYDSTNTILNNQTLSDADRNQIYLDTMDRNDFYDFCEEVSVLRLFYSDEDLRATTRLQDFRSGGFKLESLLGRLDINGALEALASKSIASSFQALVARSPKSTGRRGKGFPQIYQTYVIEKLGDRTKDPRAENKGAYMRRKQVAAMLCLLAEYGSKSIPYVGAGTIVSLSDLCIRDFLELMGSIVDTAMEREELKSISDLHRRPTPLSGDTQRVGAGRSSQAKFDGIRNAMERHGQEAAQAIDFIGKLTAKLQASPQHLSSLATPERGNFLFDLGSSEVGKERAEEKRDFLARLLRRCEADGLLRTPRSDDLSGMEATSPEWLFHLHLRFAPLYGTSYRGPYGLTRMPMAEFVEACFSPIDIKVDDLVERAFGRITRQDPNEQAVLL